MESRGCSTIAIKVYNKGELVFEQGQTDSASMFDILSGKIGICLDYGTKTERSLTELPVHSFFGEMGLLEGEPRSATAVALENDTWVKIITEENFTEYVQENGERTIKLLRQMSGRIRSLTNNYMDACRTVAESEAASRSGTAKSTWLSEHLKKFADAYRASWELAGQDPGAGDKALHSSRTAAFSSMAYYTALANTRHLKEQSKIEKGTGDTMDIKTMNKGDIIFKQGDTNSASMYDIAAGSVGIYMNYGQENEKLLTELEAGKYFGEMGLLEGYPRSATAVALADGTQVKVITADSFADYLKSDNDKTLAIMRQMSQRIRALTDDYMDACRAIAENMEAEKTGKEKTGWLREHLKKFADAYNNACVYTTSVPEDQKFSTTYAPLFYDPMYYPFL